MKNNIEYALTCQVAEFLAMALPKGSKFSHIPLGEFRHPAVAKKLKKMGVHGGVPDFLIVTKSSYPKCGQMCWIELKAPKGKPTPDQTEWGDLIENAHGGYYAICRSVEEVEAALISWHVSLRATVVRRRVPVAG